LPINQLSVLVDNKPGKMADVMSCVDKSKIKVFALSIADAGDCGLIRLIVDNPAGATRILETAGFSLAKSKGNTEVTAVLTTENETFSDVSKIIGENGINIEYAYTSTVPINGKLVLVMRLSDTEKAEKILAAKGVVILAPDDFKAR